MKFRREERVLLLMPEYIWGGAETQFRYFIAFAEKYRRKVDVIIEHRFKVEEPNLKKDAMGMKNVRFFELNEYGACREKFMQDIVIHILKNMFETKYKACLIQYTPDLAVAPILKILGIKVVYSERNDASVIRNDLGYRECLKFCKSVVANSKYAQVELEKLTGRKTFFIRNGMPVVNSLAIKEDRKIRNILVPCRIFPVKNQMMILHYLSDNKDFEGKVVFAGRIEDKIYFRKLLRFIRINKLQDKVEFLRQVNNMTELYQRADLVVLPSLFEGTPNVVLESYLYYRPVIVSDTNTVRDIVANPKLRFSLKGTKGIGNCINYIYGLSDEEYNIMLKRNREYVINNFNMEKMACSYLRLLTD